MIIFLPFIIKDFKNKMESNSFSTNWNSFSSFLCQTEASLSSNIVMKGGKIVNRPLPFLGSLYFGVTPLAFGKRKFSTELSEKKFNISEEFLFWFSGFTDGEGNFSITLDRGYIRFRFKINEGNPKGSFTRSNPISKINQVNSVRYYTTSSTNLTNITNLKLASKDLNPNWVTGFVDAEGSFSIRVYEQAGKTGWGVLPTFNLHLHSKDLALLYSIRDFFGVGRVFCYENEKSAKYVVSKMSDLTNVIIPHFSKYPLLSAKCIDLKLWVMCINILVKKEHLTLKGLNNIISIKSALNKGISDNLKLKFNDIKPLF